MVFGSNNDRTAIIYPRVSGALRCANTPYGGRTIALLLFTQELAGVVLYYGGRTIALLSFTQELAGVVLYYGGRTIALLSFTQELVVRYAALTHPTVVERSHCYHLPKS
jgi:hypothetical protein